MKKIIISNEDTTPLQEDPIDEMVLDFLIERGIIPSSFRWNIVIEYEDNVK